MSTVALPHARSELRKLVLVVTASASGTVFEWYDFFVFGLLAAIMAKQFFAGVNETAAYIFTWLTFAAGPLVRPLGALVFGRIGDSFGRKYAFLITISMMGLATFGMGLLPSYASVGVLSPALLITLRLIQGFALGGEYAGACIYLTEHAPPEKRGTLNGWLQMAAATGLAASLIVILITRTAMGEDAFSAWGWRIPFLSSLGLLVISVWIRMQLQESPLFQKLLDANDVSRAPYTESFLVWKNLKIGIIAFVSILSAQGVIWYTFNLYVAQVFLEKQMHVDGALVNEYLLIAVIFTTPLYYFFAWLSDRWGRKYLMLTAIVLSTILCIPLFQRLAEAANPALAHAQAVSPVTVVADPAACSLQFDPVGTQKFVSSCDIAKSTLAGLGISYGNTATRSGALAQVRVGGAAVAGVEGAGLDTKALAAAKTDFAARLKTALKDAGYPDKADPAQIDSVRVVGILLVMIGLCTMLYGPMASTLVELFPTRIRYTAMSLPYNLGTGWVGGFAPAVVFAMVVANGSIYFGFWYIVIVSGITAVTTLFFLPETYKRDIGAV
jgi:MFS family permease